MKKHGYWLTFATMVAAVIVTQAAAAQGGNKEKDDEDEQEIPFDEASLFFELNDTDGDLGIHGFVDGDEWKKLEIEDPFERSMLHVQVQGRLRRQGLTEVFFESAEPSFDELAPEEFFKRFPEGEYEISGVTLDGEELESVVVLSHVMPAPAPNLTVIRHSGRGELRCRSTSVGQRPGDHWLGSGHTVPSDDRQVGCGRGGQVSVHH